MTFEDPDAVRNKLIQELLDKLYQAEFSLSSVTNASGLELLLSPFERAKIEREAYRRFKKYIRNRVVEKGANFDAMDRFNIWQGIRNKLYLDRFIRSALCYLGMLGSEKINYHRLAYKLFRKLKNKQADEWPQILESSADLWRNARDLDQKPAKIIAILTAKVLYQLLYGRLRLPTPTREELYPEQADDYMEAFKERPIPSLEEPEEQKSENPSEVMA
ncbi:MAG: hypothetical protein ACXQTW_04705 [Candidatus Methanospirareceae archaeon]